MSMLVLVLTLLIWPLPLVALLEYYGMLIVASLMVVPDQPSSISVQRLDQYSLIFP